MTTLTQMREAAETLPADSPVRKMLIWADMELGDRFDQIFELEEDVADRDREIDALRLALHAVKRDLELVTAAVRDALFEMPAPDVDHAPFINCMAAQGVEPYAKAKRKPKVVTT